MWRRTLTHPDVWSNVFGLAPIAVAFYFGLNTFGWLVAALVAASFFYHYSGEKKYYLLDKSLAWAVMIGDATLVYWGNFEPSYIFWWLIFFAGAALWFYYSDNGGKNEAVHSLWHLFASAITVLSIFIFIF